MQSTLRVLVSELQIATKTRELAQLIDQDFAGEPILLVGVLKGSLHFLSDLGRALESETTIDFIQTASYHNQKESSGNIQIRKDLDINIEGLNVLIVEDIVDTGVTLTHLRELLSTRKPKSLKVVTLLSKPEARKIEFAPDYVGFDIPNEFVVGYGLDYAERYRNLPYIAILSEG